MHKNWIDIAKEIEYPSSGILSKPIKLTDGESLDVTLFCMAKGSELSEHTATRGALVHVLEGEGKFILEKEKIDMRPGTLIHMGKNAVHSLKAKTNLSFILLLH